LPIENVKQFTENLSMSPLNRRQVNWVHYKVKTGDTLASIAKKHKTTMAALRKLNHLSKNGVHRGSNLLIPNHGKEKDQEEAPAEKLALNTIESKKVKSSVELDIENTPPETKKMASNNRSSHGKYALQPGDTIYMARKKDTLESIAKHFHMDSKTLQAANHISNRRLKSGEQLIIPTHTVSQKAVKSKNNKVLPNDTVYMVRSGDTIEKIAQKFHTSPAAIRVLNFVDNSSLIVGDKLVVPTHIRS
jgi:membrane-bound lytic murein transglycosylase D